MRTADNAEIEFFGKRLIDIRRFEIVIKTVEKAFLHGRIARHAINSHLHAIGRGMRLPLHRVRF